ncbi:MAG: MFS transporter, partial [Firmicutes bacterium]|nr:MFS transporter [Bacillota bacterium]
YKTHQRQEALTFAAGSMGEKVFNGLILGLLTALLAVGGFVSSTTGGAVQPQSALDMIFNLYCWGNILDYLLLAFIMSFYKLDGREMELQNELRARELRGEL